MYALVTEINNKIQNTCIISVRLSQRDKADRRVISIILYGHLTTLHVDTK